MFQLENFKVELDQNLKNNNCFKYFQFKTLSSEYSINILHRRKNSKVNQQFFHDKNSQKCHRPKLKNICNSKGTDDNWVDYNQQRNFCVNVLISVFYKTKNQYFENLNIGDSLGNKKFGKTIKLHFSNK